MMLKSIFIYVTLNEFHKILQKNEFQKSELLQKRFLVCITIPFIDISGSSAKSVQNVCHFYLQIFHYFLF